MSRRHSQKCSIAGFLNLFGDAWTLLIVREAFYGATRFSEFQKNTGIAKNLLSDRLNKLVGEGILATADIGERGSRNAYILTPKGHGLMPVIVSMVQWSNDNVFGKGKAPTVLINRNTGKPLDKLVPRDEDGNALSALDIVAVAGPGADQNTRLRIQQADAARSD